MRKLKNTPWKVFEDLPYCYEVIDSTGYKVAEVFGDRENAKAITALPETLDKLERLEEAAQAVLNNIGHNPCSAEIANELDNLKKALEE